MSEAGVLGIDCGGTNCRVAWAAPGRRVEFIGSGANFTTNPEGCAKAIVEACEALADKAGVALAEICDAKAYLSVAGVVSEAKAAQLAQALPLSKATIEDDRRAMAIGALGEEDGFVAGLGTGSFFLRKTGDQIIGMGGWGLILGDEASGAWLGRAILSRSLQASDGLFPASALTRALIDEFGGPLAILAFAQQAEPREFARLAKGVVGAAKVGDRHGRAVMEDGAVWIAKSLRALGWTEGAPICLPGDLGAAYGLFLPEEMRAFVVRPQGSALDGALALARGLE